MMRIHSDDSFSVCAAYLSQMMDDQVNDMILQNLPGNNTQYLIFTL